MEFERPMSEIWRFQCFLKNDKITFFDNTGVFYIILSSQAESVLENEILFENKAIISKFHVFVFFLKFDVLRSLEIKNSYIFYFLGTRPKSVLERKDTMQKWELKYKGVSLWLRWSHKEKLSLSYIELQAL